MDALLAGFAQRLGHEFRDASLLETALTHRSYAHEHRDEDKRDNERLEFLGDAVLGLVVSAALCERYPKATEGELTQRRSDVVCEASLAAVARSIALGEVLRVGRGEEQTGGRQKPRLLCCALEACFGAVYLDGGFAAAKGVLEALFAAQLEGSAPGSDDHKSRLQEFSQGRYGITPSYQVVQSTGPDHDRVFRVRVHVTKEIHGEGEGRSKTEAEQRAAEQALDLPDWTGPTVPPERH